MGSCHGTVTVSTRTDVGDRACRLGEMEDAEVHRHDIERPIREREELRIADNELEGRETSARQLDHRLRYVETHFPAVDVESGHNFDILRLIRPNSPVHQPDIGAVAGRVSIEVDALEK